MWKQYINKNKGQGRGRRARGRHSRDGQANYDDADGSISSFFEPTTPTSNRRDGLSPPNIHDGGKEREPDENRPKTALEVSRMTALKASPDQVYTIGGVKIRYPYKPYPSQFSMMDKIVKGLDRSQNCLLESPTGSGKSLALLCSALAWQQVQAEKLEKESATKECCCQCSKERMTSPSTVAPNSSHYFTADAVPPPALVQPAPNPTTPAISDVIVIEDEDDDFKTSHKKIRTASATTDQTPKSRPHISVMYESPAATGVGGPLSDVLNGTSPDVGAMPAWLGGGDSLTGDCSSCQCHQAKGQPNKAPKIYYGTRTHKQIAQIARELAKTAYREARMCILSSREQTCIDPEVSQMTKKNEECKNKRDGPGCEFFNNVRVVTHWNLEANGLDSAWDLEDFIGFNSRHKSCPYYGARHLRESADIIFCPYNYLIDPAIRETMEINLKGQVVILDEAHNIEDSAREASSFSVSQQQLGEVMTDLESMIGANITVTEASSIKNMLMSLNDLIERFRDTLGGDDYDNASRVWNGVDMVAQLKNAGIGPDKLCTLKKHFGVIKDDEVQDTYQFKLHAVTTQVLGGIFMVLDYIYRENLRYMGDYRVALVRTMSYQGAQSNDSWMSKRRRGQREVTWVYTLHFWCLNPAVAFSDLSDVRSIILTSGTLSPMTSFQSELGMSFPIQLEANHVVGPKQVWVGCISKGPKGTPLLGSYQSSETYSYQDELGQLVLSICKTVPHGVLCFLSSYKMLDKLQNRWKNTGVYGEMARYKITMCEPRGSDRHKVDFDELLKYFYTVIKDTEHADPASGEVTGALFLAVCRGKVSEGMDFADNNARAVITVGIPFPNIKDTQVELKKKYNNEHSSTRGLLSGSDWYQIQAYRAINQALGRCIRHRYDWGALILVDERFAKNPARYTNGLSKWVRQRVQYYGSFPQAQRSLQEFTQAMLQCPPAANTDQSLSVSQMDLSVAVVTHKKVDPPVIPSPTPAARLAVSVAKACHISSSPPMDLEGCSVSSQAPALLRQQPVGTQAPGTFMLSSQAGGFIPSQGPTQNVVTSAHPGIPLAQPYHTSPQDPMTSTHVGGLATQVVSGPLYTQEVVIGDDIHFDPPVASTQLPGNMTFDPVITSTQMSPYGNKGLGPRTREFQPASSVINSHPIQSLSKQGSSKFASRRDSASGRTLQKPQPLETGRPSEPFPREAAGKTRQFSNQPDRDMEERSNSPILFDSDDPFDGPMSEDFDAVVREITHNDNSNKQKSNSASTVKTDSMPEQIFVKCEPASMAPKTPGKKPLFKGNPNPASKTLIIAQPGIETSMKITVTSEKSRSQKNKLSRRKSMELSKTDAPSKGVVYEDSETVSGTTDGTLIKTEAQDSWILEMEEEMLNTKRTGRSKRRKIWSNNIDKGHEKSCVTSDLLDQVSNVVKSEERTDCTVTCHRCSARLTVLGAATGEEELPGFVWKYSSSKMTTVKSVVSRLEWISGDTCLPILIPLNTGTTLNCHWDAGCGSCIQFYRCGGCGPSQSCTPVAAALVAVTPTSSLSPEQVGKMQTAHQKASSPRTPSKHTGCSRFLMVDDTVMTM